MSASESQEPKRYAERKLFELIRPWEILSSDAESLKTVEAFKNEKTVEVFLESNPETDHCIMNPDGSITLIAEVVSINTVRYPIPVRQKTKIPVSVYEVLVESKENWRLMPSIPKMQNLGSLAKGQTSFNNRVQGVMPNQNAHNYQSYDPLEGVYGL